MNIFRKIRFYGEYKKAIKDNKKSLENDFGIRIDWANRLYTILNVPDVMGEPYNLRKSDIDKASEKYISEYLSRLGNYLNSIGLAELYDFYKPPQKVDKFSYLLIIGFKHLNSVKINNVFWFGVVPISLLSLILYFINIKIIIYSVIGISLIGLISSKRIRPHLTFNRIAIGIGLIIGIILIYYIQSLIKHFLGTEIQ